MPDAGLVVSGRSETYRAIESGITASASRSRRAAILPQSREQTRRRPWCLRSCSWSPVHENCVPQLTHVSVRSTLASRRFARAVLRRAFSSGVRINPYRRGRPSSCHTWRRSSTFTPRCSPIRAKFHAPGRSFETSVGCVEANLATRSATRSSSSRCNCLRTCWCPGINCRTHSREQPTSRAISLNECVMPGSGCVDRNSRNRSRAVPPEVADPLSCSDVDIA